MKPFSDLQTALEQANSKNLIEKYLIERVFLDIDFHHMTSPEVVLKLRDYIKENYDIVTAADYMPLLNRLRLYGNFHREQRSGSANE